LLCGRPSADGGAGGRAACAGSVVQNPGVALGIVMGAAARMGRDKLTLVTAPRLEPFGLWVEQLIAESTGKKGTGIVPVAGESLGAPETYGHDRLFVRLRLHGGDADEHARDGKVERLRAAGHPIVTIHLVEPEAIGAEFVRWEIATATAGALLGINPFDEPNVQQAKDATKSLLRRYVGEQALPAPAPHLSVHGTSLTFSAAALDKMGRSPMEPTVALRAFVDLAQAGDYFGILAYLPLEAEVAARLRRLRETLRDERRIATTLGFGPRYLHSTGQLHKGGANAGQFVVITADPKQDIPIPGEPFTFGVLELAQALGDFASLEASGRRALRVHLGTYDIAALDRACALLETAARARP